MTGMLPYSNFMFGNSVSWSIIAWSLLAII